MKSTREKILFFIRKHGSTQASKLTKPLKMTLSAIRQHLSILESEGLINTKSKSQGPGRPTHHYFLTEKAESAFYKNYSALTLEILDQLGKKGLKALLNQRKEKLVQKHKEIQPPTLKSIAKIQDEAGYMAKVTRKNGLPILEEYNCPFIDVAKKYPEFCEAERAAYEEVLGKPVQLKGCRAQGANVCRFCVGEGQ